MGKLLGECGCKRALWVHHFLSCSNVTDAASFNRKRITWSHSLWTERPVLTYRKFKKKKWDILLDYCVGNGRLSCRQQMKNIDDVVTSDLSTHSVNKFYYSLPIAELYAGIIFGTSLLILIGRWNYVNTYYASQWVSVAT